MQNIIQSIKNILETNKSYAAYRKKIKDQFPEIDLQLSKSNFSYAETLYLFIHRLDSRPLCRLCNTELKYIDRSAGYGEYCSHKCYVSNGCGKIKRSETNMKRYGTANSLGNKEIRYKRKITMIEKYGSEFPLQNKELRTKAQNSYTGCDQIEVIKKRKATLLEIYGVESVWNIPGMEDKRKETNNKKYGKDYAMQVPSIAAAGVKTRIAKNGNVTSKNSSMEATVYIRQYIKDKNYSLDQVAYTDKELGLHEWGSYFDNRWNMFDLTVFEIGHRGDINYIIEVLEYHGPFHYTQKESEEKGNQPSTPWKNNKITIKESFNIDESKRKFLKDRNIPFIEIKPEKYWKDRI
jgi:hypothetical protein